MKKIQTLSMIIYISKKNNNQVNDRDSISICTEIKNFHYGMYLIDFI
jgi:hypothetical protein